MMEDGMIDHFKAAAFRWRNHFMEKIDPEDLLMNYPIEDFLEDPNNRNDEETSR